MFGRVDQVARFRDYLRGLLEPVPRKNVEAIAAVIRRSRATESDLAQSLQHFVSQSPWDSARLLSAIRRRSAGLRRDPDAVWVVHDAAFPKKGEHSVGVQRQYARSLGKKLNCQIGVFVVQVGPRGYFPLAARLYLPAAWLRDHERLIPEAHRRPATKAEIALELLAGLIGDAEAPHPIAAEAGYFAAEGFGEGLTARGLAASPDATDAIREALRRLEWLKSELGLDHFEGRTWHGWYHHVSLVFAAYHLLASESRSAADPARIGMRA